MSVMTFEGIVENGQIRLPPNAVLPEQQTVFVVVPNVVASAIPRILSPRLVDPRDAVKFEKTVVWEEGD